MSKENIAVHFPLTFTSEDGLVNTLNEAESVETWVEFLDDFDPPYQCYDAAGRRVRLIVWNLHLLVCQVVPEHFSPDRILITEETIETRPPGHRLVEEFEGQRLRAVRFEGGKPVMVEPRDWASEVTCPPGGGTCAVSTMTAKDFTNCGCGCASKALIPER